MVEQNRDAYCHTRNRGNGGTWWEADDPLRRIIFGKADVRDVSLRVDERNQTGANRNCRFVSTRSASCLSEMKRIAGRAFPIGSWD